MASATPPAPSPFEPEDGVIVYKRMESESERKYTVCALPVTYMNGVMAEMTDYGLSAREDPANTGPLMHWISMRMPNRGGAEDGTPELYFSDPDGLRIQLQDPGYCGGGGYLGDDCPPLA